MTDCGSKHGEKQQDGPGFRLGIVPMVRQLSRQLSRQSSFLRPKAINERKDYGWILLGGVILCFNAGYVNGVTLSSLHAVASAHVTGLVALAAQKLAHLDLKGFRFFVITYLSFLFGAIFSGTIIKHETFYLGRNYGRALILISLVQGVALILEASYTNSSYFIWCCALSCGMQNGLTSRYSNNALRTTHLTGTTTDLGITIGHILQGRSSEAWKLKLQLLSIIGFFAGGVVGTFAYTSMSHFALVVNVCLSGFCGLVHLIYISTREHIPLVKLLESKEDVRIHRTPSKQFGGYKGHPHLKDFELPMFNNAKPSEVPLPKPAWALNSNDKGAAGSYHSALSYQRYVLEEGMEEKDYQDLVDYPGDVDIYSEGDVAAADYEEGVDGMPPPVNNRSDATPKTDVDSSHGA